MLRAGALGVALEVPATLRDGDGAAVGGQLVKEAGVALRDDIAADATRRAVLAAGVVRALPALAVVGLPVEGLAVDRVAARVGAGGGAALAAEALDDEKLPRRWAYR